MGLVLIICLAWRPATVDALGLLAGVGAIVAWVGSVGASTLAIAPARQAIRVSALCSWRAIGQLLVGGVNGLAWLIVGVCMLGAAVACIS